MIWDDTGFLLSKSKYNENSLIVDVYTKDHGKVTGIIFGGTSKKIKNYLQIGNKIFVSFNSKSENKAGYFKVEINQAMSPYYFDSNKKLLCIYSAMQLIKILTAEAQKNQSLFQLIEKFYNVLNSKYWIKDYIFWELELFKIIGYDIKFEELVKKENIGNKFQYITKSETEKKIIPSFLIEKTPNNIDIKNLMDGLKLVGSYLDKTILRPNNLSQPISRTYFVNSLK
tara:strand:- start:324 stop:1004 length:681 start_codon:yes stop_codon:yes gene_type:complete